MGLKQQQAEQVLGSRRRKVALTKRFEQPLVQPVELLAIDRDENRALRQRQEALAAEKTTVMNRSEQVRARVEAMIGRLKAMEHSA